MASSHPGQRAALIVTVLNEAATIDGLLASIAAQTHPPDEIVVVDGGSTDATWRLLEAWTARLPLRILRAPGASIAAGRNLAVRAATADAIAVTDAGVRLAPGWLHALCDGLDDEVDVVGGFFLPDVHTAFERAMGATVLPALDDVDSQRGRRKFLPSSRSVLFRRSAFEAVGGYPEWLDYCEDLVFDLALARAGYRFSFAPEAIAWFRPRPSLPAFYRQYYRYARGDGKANLWLARHAIRYLTYITAAVVLSRRQPGVWLLLLAGGAAYTRRPYQRLKPLLDGLGPVQAAYAVGLVPVIRVVGDVAKMLGYPVGVWWRIRGGAADN